MANIESKLPTSTPLKLEKVSYGAQIFLRTLVIMGTLSGMLVMLTSKQSAVIYGIGMDARYSYSSAFMFSAIADAIACAFTVLSLFLVIILGRRGASNPANYFFLFLLDLTMTVLVVAGCAAATAIGLVGRNGNIHTGWIPICDNFGKFCNRVITSLILSYFSFFLLLVLTIICVKNSRQVHV